MSSTFIKAAGSLRPVVICGLTAERPRLIHEANPKLPEIDEGDRKLVDRLSIKHLGSENHDNMCKLLRIAFDRANALESELSSYVLELPGMSGQKYRMLINNLVRIIYKPRYLEVGSWAGSTACSVIEKNAVKVVCIDNWSLFGGPKEPFFAHTAAVLNSNVEFSFIENDFRKVDVETLGRFNIYLFDGPHEEEDQYDGLVMFQNAMDDDFIFIVDDWNWEQVRIGTFRALNDCGLEMDYAIEVRTTVDGSMASPQSAYSDWHNGYLIAKLSRRLKQQRPF